MRLTAASGPALLDLQAAAVLDARLRRDTDRPLAVAVSGGGDSLALMLIAAAWARDAGRPLLALHVDHRLNPDSARWADACAARAAALALPFRRLAWTGEKPATGLPAAARQARHALLADAAREAGCRVLLLGHTADDVSEARRMREAGSSTPSPHLWSPSPAWPQGRGLFLLRPLLKVRRADIRAWLEDRSERWIDDPANEDPRFARARARLADDGDTAIDQSTDNSLPPAVSALVTPVVGGLAVDRPGLRRYAAADAARLIATAALCAAGTRRPPAAARLAGLTARLLGSARFTATLAGARLEAADGEVRLFREAGEAARGGLSPLVIGPGPAQVWDGRFELSADRTAEVRALRGHARRLPDAQRRALSRIAAGARGGLPWLEGGSPVLGEMAGVRCRALAYERFLAACGAITREP